MNMGLVAVLGMGIVFIGLISIIILVTIMGKILQNKGAAPAAAGVAPAAAAAPKAKVDKSADEKVAAAIVAALSDQLGSSNCNITINKR